MRKIVKSTTVPGSLANAPIPTSPQEANRDVYGAQDVREQLIADQHNKCAYCECAIEKKYKDVEHYRPKNIYPWLGHDWLNLLYSCELCNRSYKNDNFPLMDESKRWLTPTEPNEEQPMIINPSTEEPKDFICFRRYMAVPTIQSGVENERGLYNIRLFHLNDSTNRKRLLNDRKEVYERYANLIQEIEIFDAIIQSNCLPPDLQQRVLLQLAESRKQLNNMMIPAASYSGMLNAQVV